jgi:hypothetical protein
MKITFESLVELADSIQLESNSAIIESVKDQLLETPLSGWKDLIEMNKAHFNVMDAGSVQEFIN